MNSTDDPGVVPDAEIEKGRIALPNRLIFIDLCLEPYIQTRRGGHKTLTMVATGRNVINERYRAMDMKVLSALQGLGLKQGPALKDALMEFLSESTPNEPVTIKRARDSFSQINRRAKQGHIQIIKDPSGEETIILSVRDLAAMIHATVNGITLSDALHASGFKPVKGHRLVLQEGLRTATELTLSKRQAKAEGYRETVAL